MGTSTVARARSRREGRRARDLWPVVTDPGRLAGLLAGAAALLVAVLLLVVLPMLVHRASDRVQGS